MPTPHAPAPGRRDEAGAGSPFPAPGQRNLSKCFRLCHPLPTTEASPRLARGAVLSPLLCGSQSLTIPIPPAEPPANAPAPSRRARAAASPQLQLQARSPNQGRARGAPGQAAPPGTGGGEAGRRQAEDRGGRDGGRVGGGTCFCGLNTLVALRHHPRPSPPSGLQLGLSALLLSVPGGRAAPRGGFCHRYKWVAWGRGGGETR